MQTVIRARRDIKRKAPSGLIKAELTNKRRKGEEPARRSSKRKASTPVSEAESTKTSKKDEVVPSSPVPSARTIRRIKLEHGQTSTRTRTRAL